MVGTYVVKIYLYALVIRLSEMIFRLKVEHSRWTYLLRSSDGSENEKTFRKYTRVWYRQLGTSLYLHLHTYLGIISREIWRNGNLEIIKVYILI